MHRNIGIYRHFNDVRRVLAQTDVVTVRDGVTEVVEDDHESGKDEK